MDIADFLGSAGVDYTLDRISSGWVCVQCPYCGPPGKHKGWYLGIRVEGTVATCWRCGILPLAKTLAEITKRPEREIWPLVKAARQRAVIQAPRKRGRLKLPRNGPLLPCHRRYLKRRGFDPDKLETLWGIRGIGQHPRYGWRILIPVRHQDEVSSFTTRAIGDDPVRYLSAKPEEESWPIKKILMGEEYVRGFTIVTEGPLKMMAVGPGATCTFGIDVTPSQLLRISRIEKRCFCFDVETKAQQKARELCRQLAALPGETLNVVLESAREVDEADKRELKRLRKMLDFA